MDKNTNIVKLDISLFSVLKIIGILLFVYFVFLVRDIIILLAISFIFSAALEPVVDKIQKKFRLPRWMGVLLVYLFFIAIIYVFVSMIAPVLREQGGTLIMNKDAYIERVYSFFSSLPQSYQNQISGVINSIPGELNILRGGAFNRVFGIFSGISGLAIVFVMSFYILSLKNGMNQTISVFIPQNRRKVFVKVFAEIIQKMSLWFKGQLLLSFIIGLVTFVGLWAMHIPYALILAVIAGFTELIPIIGPVLGAIPAVIVAFFISPVMALIVIAFYVFIQQTEAHVLVPQVMKRAVGLSPIVVIFSMLVGAKLLGILGVILAVPVTSAISVILKEWSASSSLSQRDGSAKKGGMNGN